MIRNIANVVHDLNPIVKYLKEKALKLPQAANPAELMDLIEKIQRDAVMLERYLEALDQNAKAQGILKNEETFH